MRRRLEGAFGDLARLALRAPRLVVCLLLCLAGGLAWHIPQMRTENSSQSYLRADSPSRVRYDEFRDQYGREDLLIVVVEGRDLFDLDFLQKIRSLHSEIETRVPYVKEVTSLVNARYTVGEDERLVVGELLEDWPRTPREAELARQRAFANPLYQDTLISLDGTATSLLVSPMTYRPDEVDDLMGFDDDVVVRDSLRAEDMEELAAALHEVTSRYDSPDFRIHTAGDIPLNAHFTGTLATDMQVVNATSTIAVAIVLFLLFRSFVSVILPLAVVGSAVAATQGAMVVLDIPLSSPLEIVPPLLLTVGVCGAVHLLTMFEFELKKGKHKEEAIVGAAERAGPAIAMASFTTALGLLSFVVADVVPVSHVGIIAPLGVALTFVYNVSLLPALMAILPIGTESIRSRREHPLAHWLHGASTVSKRGARVVVGVALLVSALAAAGVAQLQFSQNHLMWFPEDDAIRRGTELVDSSFAGAMTAEVIIDTGIEGGVYEPEFLERVSRAAEHAEQLRHGEIAVGKAISIVDIIEETHQALNENDPHFRTIPGERGAIAQLLLLFENTGAEDLMDFTDARFREARISLRVTHSDAIAYLPFLDRLRGDLTSIFGDGNRIQLTGLMTLLTEGLSAIVSSTARSYVIAFAAILPTMLVMIGNRQRGLLSVIPNLFPVLLVLGVMGWAGIGIDASTLMVGGIILGLAVDDTIHFFHNYERVFHQSGDVRRSIKETLETTGVALVTTSLVLAAGFSSFGFAYMTNVSTLGFLLAFATLAALAGDLFLVPALLILVCRNDNVEKVPQLILLESERGAWRKTPLTSAEPSISPETVREREKTDERTPPPPLV